MSDILHTILFIAGATGWAYGMAYFVGMGWWAAEKNHRKYKPTDVYIHNSKDKQ